MLAIIGVEAAQKVTTTFGGTYLRIPCCKAFANQVRDASVRDCWRNSTLSAVWVAWLHDLSERQIRNITRGEPRPALKPPL
nr:Mor transcription activator family protein [Xanthomonas arboricola]